jgi:hypothetical protein
MKEFRKLAFDLRRCSREVGDFQRFLKTRQDLKEEEHIRPFFEQRPHLSVLLGGYNSNISHFDQLAYQYPLAGDFTCDLVVGDSVNKAFSFIEFEDAGAKSLFVKRAKKVTREWAPRFDHGYSQLIDWFCKLDDMEKSDDFEARFGARSISFKGILISGRDHNLLPGEQTRLAWRRNNVTVRSQTIHCLTIDELLKDLLGQLKTFTLAARVGG